MLAKYYKNLYNREAHEDVDKPPRPDSIDAGR